jgi:S-adenosylmethionine hydrolase
LVDISHDIPPQDVIAGALVLAEAASWFPRGTVFLAVVDPGVGSGRRLLAAEADGRRFVGPDNGLLGLALARASRRRVVRIANRRLWRTPLSTTFHGRDILAPVAARLALGDSLDRVGAPVRAWQPAPWPEPSTRGARHVGQIVAIDHFGNAITNLPADRLARPSEWRASIRGRRARVVSSYQEGRRRELLALVGSHGHLELAIRDGSAAAHLRLRRGDRVTVARA